MTNEIDVIKNAVFRRSQTFVKGKTTARVSC